MEGLARPYFGAAGLGQGTPVPSRQSGSHGTDHRGFSADPSLHVWSFAHHVPGPVLPCPASRQSPFTSGVLGCHVCEGHLVSSGDPQFHPARIPSWNQSPRTWPCPTVSFSQEKAGWSELGASLAFGVQTASDRGSGPCGEQDPEVQGELGRRLRAALHEVPAQASVPSSPLGASLGE